jgi:hypothetical protein
MVHLGRDHVHDKPVMNTKATGEQQEQLHCFGPEIWLPLSKQTFCGDMQSIQISTTTTHCENMLVEIGFV